MGIHWEGAMSSFLRTGDSEVAHAELRHMGGSTGYVAGPNPDWAAPILEFGGPLHKMWDGMESDETESALLFGRLADSRNWLAVRPKRRISDDREVTEIHCRLSADPLQALISSVPSMESISSDSQAVGFHGMQHDDVELGESASLSDAIECWAMSLDPTRSGTGISAFCDAGIAQMFAPSKRWVRITRGREPSEFIRKPDEHDPLADFRKSAPFEYRARGLQALEALSGHHGETAQDLLLLLQESIGAARYSSLGDGDRARILLKLGDRDGAFRIVSADPRSEQVLSEWRAQVGGTIPFSPDELDALAGLPGLDIWAYLRRILDRECQNREREDVLALLSRSGLGACDSRSFLKLCPDYMTGSPSRDERGSVRRFGEWDDADPATSVIRACVELNSNQPDPMSDGKQIESRTLNMLGMMQDDHPGGDVLPEVSLRTLFASDPLFDEVSLDRSRIAPFMVNESIRLDERTRWAPLLTPGEVLEIHDRAEAAPEWSLLRGLIESDRDGSGIGRGWPHPSAIPSGDWAYEGMGGPMDRLLTHSRLLERPRLGERITFRMPSLLAALSVASAALSISSAAWTIGGTLSLALPLFSILPSPDLPADLGALGQHSHLVVGLPVTFASMAVSIALALKARRRREASREFRRTLEEGGN